VVPAEGGAARKIGTGQIADYQRLGWSPDSKLVGYIALDPDVPGDENGWAALLDGGAPTKIATLTQGASRGPVYERAVLWSPDFKWVVVAGVNNPMKLMRWPLSQGNPGDERDIAGGEPDWSPDSRALFYSQTLSGALWLYEILEADSTPYANEANFDGTGMGEYAQGPGPRISPAATGNDSDPIAYRSHTGAGEPRVSIRRRGRRELAALPGLTNNPSWSPNGDMLVVESGTVQEDSLGPKWVPTGLGIAQLNMTGEHAYTPLVENAKWPAWGK
jgi:hypothetical protein